MAKATHDKQEGKEMIIRSTQHFLLNPLIDCSLS